MNHHNHHVIGSPTLSLQPTGLPCEVTAAYVADRIAIERRHAGNDDGTATLYARAAHGMEYYSEPDGPVTDDSPVARLMEFGLGQREYELLETNRCCTIGKTRRLLRLGVIQGWENSGEKTAAAIRRALRRIDEGKGATR